MSTLAASRWARDELAQLEAQGLLRKLEPLQGAQGPRIQLGGTRYLNFSSNDYLALAGDPRLAAAAALSQERHGMGSGASRLVVGDFEAHRHLEVSLASFMGAEAALLFNSGYAANVGVLSSLAGPEDVIFSDALNHASIVDGCRLSRARVVVYPHGDLAFLARSMAEQKGRRQLVATDAVFSMDGDAAPLRGLVDLCQQRGAALVVDEAHAVGVFGPHGAGLCEALGVREQVDVRMGTLGKAIGSFGAFVAVSRELRQLFIQRARSLIFSTSLPPSVCAAADRGLELLMAEPQRREALWLNIHRFASGLRQLGLPGEPRSAIFSVIVGRPERALELSAFLRERGVLAKPIRPPAVPEGTCRLRFALCAGHTPADVDQALRALHEARDHGLLRTT